MNDGKICANPDCHKPGERQSLTKFTPNTNRVGHIARCKHCNNIAQKSIRADREIYDCLIKSINREPFVLWPETKQLAIDAVSRELEGMFEDGWYCNRRRIRGCLVNRLTIHKAHTNEKMF